MVNAGLARLQDGHEDLYKPGTIGRRAYIRGLIKVEAIKID